jgi:hypothetical protein
MQYPNIAKAYRSWGCIGRLFAVDYRCDVWGLLVRFRRVEHVDGEPTGDGKVIVYYDKRGKVVAVEITNITTL